ncbi:MAG: acylphosphatase [Ignavibacteria bacterium]|nr:acylphosphatase [Ignavibacteria bacterium]
MRAHIIVSGLVQGVGYRYFIHRKATELELKGFVRNLYNGDVEIVVEGEKDKIQILIEHAKIGPRMAFVKDLKIEWEEDKNEFTDFRIRGW